MNTTDTAGNKQVLREYVESLGLTYQAQFVPMPQPADKVEHPQLHWLITLTKGRQSMAAPYHEGCAHVQGYQQYHKNPYEARKHKDMVRLVCETGKLYRDVPACGWRPTTKPQPVPDVLDVLYCLVNDADVLNSGGFEEWASDYGYDPDSRKAEQIYHTCIDQSLKLKSVIGQAALDRLRELFRDY